MSKMISRNTVLLRGNGRTDIEYRAGPNIAINDDVISGRDWTHDIQDAVNSGVAGQLAAGDNIALNTENSITTISVTGDLYSAGPNIDITDRVVSGKDWTNDISDQIASAISGKADTSAIPEMVEYSAGDNIDIAAHVISGKDWSYEIGLKADRFELLETASAVAERLSETISSTSAEIIDIISATSGQGGSACPWISGAKDYDGDAYQLEFGGVVPLLSGWDLSGDHNHSICMKGRYFRLPEAPFVTQHEYDDFISAGFRPNISALYTSAAYLSANKLDISAFDAYSAAHSGSSGIEVIETADSDVTALDSTWHKLTNAGNVAVTLDTSVTNYGFQHTASALSKVTIATDLTHWHIVGCKDRGNGTIPVYVPAGKSIVCRIWQDFIFIALAAGTDTDTNDSNSIFDTLTLFDSGTSRLGSVEQEQASAVVNLMSSLIDTIGSMQSEATTACITLEASSITEVTE